MRPVRSILWPGALFLAGLLIVGCESTTVDSTSSTTTEDDATVDVTGTWLYTDTAASQWSMTLTQSSSTISGTTTKGAAVSGSISSNTVVMTVANTNGLVLRGTASTNGMSGSFTYSTTNSVEGIWTAVRTQ